MKKAKNMSLWAMVANIVLASIFMIATICGFIMILAGSNLIDSSNSLFESAEETYEYSRMFNLFGGFSGLFGGIIIWAIGFILTTTFFFHACHVCSLNDIEYYC